MINLSNSKLDFLKNTINFKKDYVLSLHKRLLLIREGFCEKSEFQRNEIDILKYETVSIINNANNFIKKKEEEYRIELGEFYEDLNDLEKNYKTVVDTAKKKSEIGSVLIRHILYHTNWKYLDDNIDEKIKLFKDLKELI
jgi:hypothetical protein